MNAHISPEAFLALVLAATVGFWFYARQKGWGDAEYRAMRMKRRKGKQKPPAF